MYLYYNLIVGVRTANLASSNGAVGPSSQIPGLSANADITPEEKTKGGRRVGVQASDSDYVKLAKQGGQRGNCVTLECVVFKFTFNFEMIYDMFRIASCALVSSHYLLKKLSEVRMFRMTYCFCILNVWYRIQSDPDKLS